MDDPVPIEGILDGEPEALAVVCAAGGSAIAAYCSAVGADAYVADTVVTALATFRRGVIENANQEPAQLETLLLTATADAVRDVAGVHPSPIQQAAARAALETAVTAPLTPGLAPRIIRALVDAAPVTALGGDAAAVRRATEQHYIRMLDGQPAPAPVSAAAPASVSGGARPPAPAPPPPAPAPATAAAAPAAWIPPEIAGLDAEAANARAVAPGSQWSTAPEQPADAPAAPQPQQQPQPQPQPQLQPQRELDHLPPADTPPVPRTTLGDQLRRLTSRRQRRRPSYGSAVGRGRNMVIAALVGLAVGAGIGVLATPEKTVRQNTTLVRPLDTPFTVGGAVFNVARTSQALWARAIRGRPPRAGRTWITLAAQTRNVSRASFHPRGLGYRLRTDAGVVIGPETALVAGEIPAVGGRLPIGKRTSVHLGFQVPSGKVGLTLEFDPGPSAPRIRVPLN